MELTEEHIVNWSEHLFNPHRHKLWLPGLDYDEVPQVPPRHDAQNGMFMEIYGSGRRSIMMTARQTGRTAPVTAAGLALLRSIFSRVSNRPAPPVINPRQERSRRRFLRGQG